MAIEAHFAILHQGVDVWNTWRKKHRRTIPDLSSADLSGINLAGINLDMARLENVNFGQADLTRANLGGAVLVGAKLIKADLTFAELHNTNLCNADLAGADLKWARLHRTNLNNANLQRVDLYQTVLHETSLEQTDFEQAHCGRTFFSNIDLSNTKNLHLIQHSSPSTIGMDTLIKSQGKMPIEFLEGCGVPKHILQNMQYLVDIPTIQYYSCFISYSTKDEKFTEELNDRMKRKGLRVWFAPEEMKGGKKIHEQLYEAIRYHDKLILVLSEASMSSSWVQSEIRRARKHEREDNRRKLFPISLVPFSEIQKWELFDADEGRDLAQEIREYYIPDFSNWKDYDKFNVEFDKLLKSLKTDY